MKNFFQSDRYTEILTEANELWVIGDSIENLTSETPRLYVCTCNPGMWGDGTEITMEMPITNDHGDLDWVNARVFESDPVDMIGTEAEQAIKTSQRYHFNAGRQFEFNDFFHLPYCQSRAKAIISDNKSDMIIDFKTAYDYIWENIVNFDNEIYSWLKDESVEKYDKLDSFEKGSVTELLHDWLQENYNIVPS